MGRGGAACGIEHRDAEPPAALALDARESGGEIAEPRGSHRPRACPPIRGVVFDSSVTMAEAAAQATGVALLPVRMFRRELRLRRLVQPFPIEIAVGAYWLTALKSKRETAAMQAFRAWLLDAAAADQDRRIRSRPAMKTST
jgi:DNA-binding transcriptional LysR family regulator